MRRLAALVLGALVLVPSSAATAESAPPCAKRSDSAPRGLPAAVVLTTRCAAYIVHPNGRVAARSPERERQTGITWMAVAGKNAHVVQRGARMAVLRDGREVWRSTGPVRATSVFAVLGTDAVAFSYERYGQRTHRQSLFVASLRGAEREIASDEWPLGWTKRGELLTSSYRDGFSGVYLRAVDGTFVRRLASRLREIRFDPVTRTVLALHRSGVLLRVNDRRRTRLADLRALGFRRERFIERLDAGLIGVVGANRVAVLRPGGSLFASAVFPRRKRLLVAGNSGLVANAEGTAVAFAVTEGNNGYGVVGRESLYVLRSGDRRAERVFGRRLRFAICERWASLAWHEDWLLYATTEGRTVALDTRAPARQIDLTDVVMRVATRTGEGKVAVGVRWLR
jgi:hypothetical protein